MRFLKPKSPEKKTEKKPTPVIKDEIDPVLPPEQVTPLPAPEQENPLPEPLAGIAANIEHAMRCSKCNGYLRQYPGGFRLCPNCDSALSY